MELRKLSEQTGKWFKAEGPFNDIVISSRVRLARNLAGYKFVNKCSEEERTEILDKLKKVLLDINVGEKMNFFNVEKAGAIDKDFLVERHLISRHLSKAKGVRGVVVGDDEMAAAMINEEDHLRIQVLKPGLQLRACWEVINKLDDMVEAKVDYAFSPEYGYLTACPTNVGTGIRVSVMLHLPGLKMAGHLEKFFNALKDMNLAVRGLFGEGTDAVGDFFQVSNQATLGVKEEDIVRKFEEVIVPKIVDYERDARKELSQRKSKIIDDKIYRALGILKHAQMISSNEALFLLSHLRLGVNLKRVDCVGIDKINELFMLTLPGHLQMSSGGPLGPDGRDELRAKIIRSYLNKN